MISKVGMVFGVFDGLHKGHQHFLNEAKKMCETLYVVATRDEVSLQRKGFLPEHSLADRMDALIKYDSQFLVVPGDLTDGDWHVLDQYDPNRVILGYDQGSIGEAMKKMGIPFSYVDAFQPTRFKSSIRRLQP